VKANDWLTDVTVQKANEVPKPLSENGGNPHARPHPLARPILNPDKTAGDGCQN
jgi:hypothetical protein